MGAVEAFHKEINAPICFSVSAYTSEGVNLLLPFIAKHAQEVEQMAIGGDVPSRKRQNEKAGCC
jgi:hypothetical protein